jgi:hypothetical protein
VQGYEAVVIIPLALAVTYFLLTLKAKWARTTMETYLQENNLDATVEKSGIPPLRMWIRNRKGDAWCRLRYTDGAVKWARIRSRWGSRAVDFFE